MGKGTNIGVDSLYAQQITLQEKAFLKEKRGVPNFCCPRIDAIKWLNNIIASLQEQNHAVILMIDANQSLLDCSSSKGIKTFSIQWLHIQRGMVDPFVQSNHLGIVFVLDLRSFFSANYLDICSLYPRSSTSGNESSVLAYIKYVNEQMTTHKIPERVQQMLDFFLNTPGPLPLKEANQLNTLDEQITEILLSGEWQCAKRGHQCHPWSPQQREIARMFSYWKQKLVISKQRLFRWDQLDRHCAHTSIS